MNILVTGAEGFIGSHLTERLVKLGHKVEVVDSAIGGGQCIMIDRKEGILIGGSDPRKDGLAIGY